MRFSQMTLRSMPFSVFRITGYTSLLQGILPSLLPIPPAGINPKNFIPSARVPLRYVLMRRRRRALLVSPDHVYVKNDERHGQDGREDGDVRQRRLSRCQFQGISSESFGCLCLSVAIDPGPDDRLKDRDAQHSYATHERHAERAGTR